jgi:hypothetical protein
MPEEPTKRRSKTTAPKARRKPKVLDAAPSGKTVRVGGEMSLQELARQAGLPLRGSRATIAHKTIRKASDGTVLIKESDLLTLLRADASARVPSARGIAKGSKASPRPSPSVVSKRETELLGRINVGLPEPQSQRLEALDARRQEETLTPEEHAELLTLVDQSERLAVGRAAAVLELARLRGATVPAVMRALGLGVAGRG